MNKEQFLGQLRALLTVVGAALATFGYHRGYAWEPVIGVLVLMVSLGWALYEKDGWDATQSVLRKLVSAVGTAVVTYGLMAPDRTEALLAVVGPLLAIYGSWKANGGKFNPPAGAVKVLVCLLAAGALLGLSGCAQMEGYRVQGGILTDSGTILLDDGGVITIEIDGRSGK